MSHEIARDLSRKTQRELAAVLERETALAGVVLDDADVAVLMIEAGVMMVRTVSATIANQAGDAVSAERTFDHTVEAIAIGVKSSREDSLRRIAAYAAENA